MDNNKIIKLAEVPIGHWLQGVACTYEGQHILVQNLIEKNIMVLKVVGD